MPLVSAVFMEKRLHILGTSTSQIDYITLLVSSSHVSLRSLIVKQPGWESATLMVFRVVDDFISQVKKFKDLRLLVTSSRTMELELNWGVIGSSGSVLSLTSHLLQGSRHSHPFDLWLQQHISLHIYGWFLFFDHFLTKPVRFTEMTESAVSETPATTPRSKPLKIFSYPFCSVWTPSTTSPSLNAPS